MFLLWEHALNKKLLIFITNYPFLTYQMKKYTAQFSLILLLILGTAGLYWISGIDSKMISLGKEEKISVPFESTSLATKGEAIDQYKQGKMLAEELNPPDNKTAVKWYTLAAKKGFADAQNDLGVMHEQGRGIKQNYKGAVKWYTLAAKQGVAISQHNLAVMYEKGRGVKQNYKTAIKWYTLAAKQRLVDSQNNLGVIYEKGLGVAKNNIVAVKWYTLAAEKGDSTAQFNLGRMFDEGLGVPKDDKTAMNWYTLAAEQGKVIAQYNLGVMYGKGEGVLQDNVYAHMWLNIAASLGDKDAFKYRDIVAKRMSLSDITAAKRLDRECMIKNYKGC